MGRKRKNGQSEEKRNIIGQLIEIYDIKTAADIQEALKDLLGGTIQNMLETELEEQMEDREEEDPEYHDSRNGYKHEHGGNPHPGTAGPKQRLRAAGGAKV